MPDREVLSVCEEILALLEACGAGLDACRTDLAEIKGRLGRLVDAGDAMDGKLAVLEGDVSHIRRHLDGLPDNAIPGHGHRR